MLLVLSEVYRQQLWLFKNNKQSIEDRIVSLSQPQIRPIVRGKAGKPVEFGAKLSASCFEGKFGQGKRRFSLERVMAKLPNTSETAIAITFLVMNLSTALRRFFCVFLSALAKTTLIFGLFIIKTYRMPHYTKNTLMLSSA